MGKPFWFIIIMLGIVLIINAFLPVPGQGVSLFKAGVGLALIVIAYLKLR